MVLKRFEVGVKMVWRGGGVAEQTQTPDMYDFPRNGENSQHYTQSTMMAEQKSSHRNFSSSKSRIDRYLESRSYPKNQTALLPISSSQ